MQNGENPPLKNGSHDHVIHRNHTAKKFLGSVSCVRVGNCNTLVYTKMKNWKHLYNQMNWASANTVVADRILLNVGGKIFATARQILGKEKYSLLLNIEGKGFIKESRS